MSGLVQNIRKNGDSLVASFKGVGEQLALLAGVKYQTKTISSSFLTDGGTITELSYDLEAGKTYMIITQFHVIDENGGQTTIEARDGGVNFVESGFRLDAPNFSATRLGATYIRQMQNDDLTFVFQHDGSGSNRIQADDTFVTVIELPGIKETNEW